MCRAHSKDGWALDDVVNLTRVVNMEKEEVRKGPGEGVYIYGLFSDGCRWDGRQSPTRCLLKILFAPLPVLLVTGQLSTEKKADSLLATRRRCYREQTRRGLNFIFAVGLEERRPPPKWILRGVCLLCVPRTRVRGAETQTQCPVTESYGVDVCLQRLRAGRLRRSE